MLEIDVGNRQRVLHGVKSELFVTINVSSGMNTGSCTLDPVCESIAVPTATAPR